MCIHTYIPSLFLAISDHFWCDIDCPEQLFGSLASFYSVSFFISWLCLGISGPFPIISTMKFIVLNSFWAILCHFALCHFHFFLAFGHFWPLSWHLS